MIKTIVLSYNRASQLDLLMQSIWKNARFLMYDLSIFYKHSDDRFKIGYDDCKGEWAFNWVYENNFQDDIVNLLDTNNPYTVFFTDDDIFYRAFPYSNDLITLFEEFEIGCFSFRLGNNTIVQDQYQNVLGEPPQTLITVNKTFQIWDRNQARHNFSYSFSVDGHVYRTKTLLTMAKSVKFDLPNAFEARMCEMKSLISPLMCSCDQSFVFSNPINTVSPAGTNSGRIYPRSVSELNELYLSGKRIKLDKLCFDIKGCHQEIPLVIE